MGNVAFQEALDLLACPRCGGALRSSALACTACGAGYEIRGGIPDLRLPADRRTEAVRKFYEQTPFPAYPPRDSHAWLRARAGRSEFARLLDRAIPGDARILELGCGTGQMSLFLASADRIVVGADLTRASLELAEAARQRFGVERALFVETDLRVPGLRRGAFDVVYSSGVLHHTPDPRGSFAAIARLVRPGGILVVGSTTRTRGCRTGCAAPSHVSPASAGSLSTRCSASGERNLHAARRGYAISIATSRSIATRSARCRIGSARTRSSTCARIPRRSSPTSRCARPSSSNRPATTGHSRTSSRSFPGRSPSPTKAAFLPWSGGRVRLRFSPCSAYATGTTSSDLGATWRPGAAGRWRASWRGNWNSSAVPTSS